MEFKVGDRVVSNYAYHRRVLSIGEPDERRVVSRRWLHCGVWAVMQSPVHGTVVQGETFLADSWEKCPEWMLFHPNPSVVAVLDDITGGEVRLNPCWLEHESKYGWIGRFIHNLHIRWLNWNYFTCSAQYPLEGEEGGKKWQIAGVTIKQSENT